ncbi:GTP-binding protein [Luteirhabdus pelagi]|uniref:GTP-binding protein n=1 Tax=Luteirhabdus pelagi TaxID=2792783 RepID=UPI001939304A|nr:GTP-binding protein [Luteirhabdus pelagi]
MKLSNEVVLRPRFQMELQQNMASILEAFQKQKELQNSIVVSLVDEHIFLKIPRAEQHIWSPQLHLELLEREDGSCMLFGTFGPNPRVWTLFMFLHFLVGTAFLGFAVWAYSNASLKEPYALQVLAMGLLLIGWFVLYFVGRMGKKAGRKEMIALHLFMKDTLHI